MQPGKMMFRTFTGDPLVVTEEVNAFLEAHDLMKFPVAQTVTNFNTVEGKTIMTIVMIIVSPAGQGKIAVPTLARNGAN